MLQCCVCLSVTLCIGEQIASHVHRSSAQWECRGRASARPALVQLWTWCFLCHSLNSDVESAHLHRASWWFPGYRQQRLQEHRQEVSQREVRAYTRSTSRSLACEQNKSAVTDHAISLNHVIDWDQAKVIDRESNRVDRWIKEATMHIRKEQDKSMNRDEGSYQLSHIYDNLFAPNPSGERRLDRPFWRRLQSKLKRQH